MKPVYQAVDPGVFRATDNGECLRACVASILELPLAEVPHFMETAERARVWPVALAEWLRGRGLELDALAPPGDLSAVLNYMATCHPGEYFILGGRSGPDFGHVVIGRGGGGIVHDPSPRVPPGVISLQGPLPTGRYLVMMIRPKSSPILPAPVDFEPLARHQRAGLMLSGGKDSIALVYLFREHLDRIMVYHVDTGDMMPETVAVVDRIEAMCPNFIRIKSDARAWIAANGLPSDLAPAACGPVGLLMDHGAAGGVPIVDKWTCCAANRWAPANLRTEADGMTLNIRGTRRCEPGWGLLAALGGERVTPCSVVPRGMTKQQEIWTPIEAWTDDDVFAYLRSVGAPIPRHYECKVKSPECARCPAGWDEGRAAYLKQHHPELAADYARDLRAMRAEILKPLAHLAGELEVLGG